MTDLIPTDALHNNPANLRDLRAQAERLAAELRAAAHPQRADVPPLPDFLAHLPIDARGYPVPFFVAYVNGVPDHRIMDPSKYADCITKGVCWLCGLPLGIPVTFAIGPMCAVNRISSEPPSHRACAEYSMRACPFLTRPHAHRRDAGKPAEAAAPGGTMIPRNPGVLLLWTTKSYQLIGDGKGGRLLELGSPTELVAYTEGRLATWPELEAAFESGLPALIATLGPGARDQRDGRRAIAQQAKAARVMLRAFAGVAHA